MLMNILTYCSINPVEIQDFSLLDRAALQVFRQAFAAVLIGVFVVPACVVWVRFLITGTCCGAGVKVDSHSPECWQKESCSLKELKWNRTGRHSIVYDYLPHSSHSILNLVFNYRKLTSIF